MMLLKNKRKPLETTIISQSNKADDLVKYAELFEKGLISEEEFNELKNEIIPCVSDSNFNENIDMDCEDENINFCTNCGFKGEPNAIFCPSCGNKLD